MSPEENTATFAGPPRVWPAMPLANSMKKSAAPARSANAPKMTNSTMYAAATPSATPQMPLSVMYM